MNHNQAFYTSAGLLFSVYQLCVALPICIMVYMAMSFALRQKQQIVLKWLLPLTLVHTIGLVFYVYQLGFRLLHLRAGLISTMAAYGFGVIGGLVSLYTTWRILDFVKGFQLGGSQFTSSKPHEEDVWPPPPIQKS